MLLQFLPSANATDPSTKFRGAPRHIGVAFCSEVEVEMANAKEVEDRIKKAEIDARARNISHNVRCTECGSQSIEDSQADIAILLRKLIRDEIRSGKSDKEIFQKLEKDYGETILYAPRFDIQTAALWLSPFVVGGTLAGLWAYRRHRQKTNVHLMAIRLLDNIPLTWKERETMLELLQPSPPKRKWWSWSG